MLTFQFEPLYEIVPQLSVGLAASGSVSFAVPDPALGLGLYAGEAGPAGLHRPLSTWADLADLLEAHLLLAPAPAPGLIGLELRRRGGALKTGQNYGPGSEFARADKLEDPSFLLTLVEALRRVSPPAAGRVLALGPGTGRELSALALAWPPLPEVVALDWNAEALQALSRRYPQARCRVGDIAELPKLAPELGRFDLVLALSVLQSPSVPLDTALRCLCRDLLTPGGGLILGFPNARYCGGELSYGARMKNFARPDLSLLFADVAQVRRTLHKRGFKVFVTGKYEVLVTAIPAEQKTPPEAVNWLPAAFQ